MERAHPTTVAQGDQDKGRVMRTECISPAHAVRTAFAEPDLFSGRRSDVPRDRRAYRAEVKGTNGDTTFTGAEVGFALGLVEGCAAWSAFGPRDVTK